LPDSLPKPYLPKHSSGEKGLASETTQQLYKQYTFYYNAENELASDLDCTLTATGTFLNKKNSS